MNNFIQQYTSQLQQLTEKNRTDKSSATVLPSAQLVMPTIAWDWPPASIGMMTNNSFEFADGMPASCQSEVIYQPSADSFTDNYRSFLALVKGSNQALTRMIRQARRKIAIPAGNPANDPTPSGWTIAKINGLIRWRPVWNFSDTAHDWLQKVQSGRINNPGTITIKLDNQNQPSDLLVTKKSASSRSEPVNSKLNFTQVVIEAKSWGQISINPGSWYDSAILALTASELSPELHNTYFGHNGLLSCRLASFYVAYQIKVTFHGQGIDPALLNSLNDNSNQILALGVPVKPSVQQYAGSLQLEAVAPDPAMVAVGIENMNPMTDAS